MKSPFRCRHTSGSLRCDRHRYHRGKCWAQLLDADVIWNWRKS